MIIVGFYVKQVFQNVDENKLKVEMTTKIEIKNLKYKLATQIGLICVRLLNNAPKRRPR